MSLESTMSSPTPLSFACAEEIFGNLAVQHTAQLVANASDITLITDNHGVIRDLAFQSPSLFDEVGRGWVDQKMVDVVTSECVNKVEELLGAAQDGHEVRAREINHLTKDGSNLPMQYWAMRLGDGDMIVVFGMDISRISDLQQKLMNSQLSVEREFAQLRSAESHYRMMFQLSDTPQIVVDATSLRVSDINETATRLFGRTHQQIGDMKVLGLFESSNTNALHQLFRAANDDQAGDVNVKLKGGDAITISAALFRQNRKNYLLLRLLPSASNVSTFFDPADRQILKIVNELPDAIVVTDGERRISAVNNAFVDLMNLSGPGEALGQPIDNWFDRPRVDCNVLMANIKEHGSVRRFATVFRSNYGQVENVELSAIQIKNHGEPAYGFAIRVSAAANSSMENQNRSLAQTDEQITNLVGQIPLKDIVRETTDIIEKMCIETALDLTNQNRAMAAQMLGLSRQSFYAKMGRK